ncbi:hypothetical protein ABFS83_09G112900 [Erythranthe nasuta]
MNKHKRDQIPQNPRKRKWINNHTKAKKKQEIDATANVIDNTANVIDKLPDDLLIAILSRMKILDAYRTSVLSRRWRYLWTLTNLKLEFNDRDITTDGHKIMTKDKLSFFISQVLRSHKSPSVDTLIIRIRIREKAERRGVFSSINTWINRVILKDLKRLELDLSVPGTSPCNYVFPDLGYLLVPFPRYKYYLIDSGCSVASCLRSANGFTSLRSIKLVDVSITDEVVGYFIESCLYIEDLCIRGSNATKDLKFVDPLPYFKVLEISDCCNIESLLISVENLVSCTYQGNVIGLPFKKVPKVSELTLGGVFCESFVYEPNKHSSYSTQLLKLVLNLHTASVLGEIVPRDLPQLYALKQLELSVVSRVGRSLLFLTSLIKASPQLQEFKIKINYIVPCCQPYDSLIRRHMPFPEVTAEEANVFEHENLKVIEMVGYCGCASEDEFIVSICKIAATSLETVIIDTDCDYYRDVPNYTQLLIMYKPREDGKVPIMKGVKTGRVDLIEPTENGNMNPLDAKKHAEKLISSFRSLEIKKIVR